MRPSSPAFRRVGVAVLCSVTSLVWLACGDSGKIGPGCEDDGSCPAGSQLQVVVTTVGPSADPDGYTVNVEGEATALTVQANGTVSIDGLVPADHSVRLSGLAANCSVSGTNPKSVTILAKLGVSVPPPVVASFLVTCGVGTGRIVVRTTTTGPAPDPDGYRLLLDGVDQGGIGVQTTVTLNGVTTSQEHTIALGEVNANCQLRGTNPLTLQVLAEGQVEAGFTIDCQPPPPESGALRVTVTTSGQDPDPDGYAVSVDGGTPQPIGSNATVTISGLGVGQHQLQVSGTADNCAVQGAASTTATVVAGDTTEVGLAVACTARPGSIEVKTSTTGPPAGDYSVTLDTGTPQAIGANASLTLADVAAGLHTVTLSGFAGSCAPTGGAVRSVTVAGGASSRVSYTVNCAAPNTAPTATNDAYNATTGVAFTTTTDINGLLVNDTDPEGGELEVLNFDLVTPPEHALDFKVFRRGGFRYTSLPDFTGTDQFTYQAIDPAGAPSAPATVTITVAPNAPPLAQPDAYQVTSGSFLTINGPGVLGNDADPEGDPLVAVLVSSPSSGTVSLNQDGGFSYTPNAPFSGEDAFTYLALDSHGAGSSPATVTITVTAGNLPPVAVDDSYSASPGVLFTTVTAIDGLLVNDTDPEGGELDVLNFELVAPPAHAVDFKVFKGGGFRYQSQPDFTGTDTFTYQAVDPAGAPSNTATVTINVQ
jgi:hypothetical protein